MKTIDNGLMQVLSNWIVSKGCDGHCYLQYASQVGAGVSLLLVVFFFSNFLFIQL